MTKTKTIAMLVLIAIATIGAIGVGIGTGTQAAQGQEKIPPGLAEACGNSHVFAHNPQCGLTK